LLLVSLAACSSTPPPSPPPLVVLTAAEPASNDAGSPPAVPSVAAAPPGPSLYEAAKDGDLARVKELVVHGAGLEAEAPPYGTPLMAALEFEREDVARVLLNAGAKVSPRSMALVVGARGGLVALFPLLIARGADPNATGGQGYTALHSAAKYGHTEAVRKLVAMGAIVNVAADDGFTPLCSAVADDRLETAWALLDAGARVDARTRGGTTVLHWAVFANRPSEIEEFPIHPGGQPTSMRKVRADANMVELILSRGAPVNATDDDGNSPLHEAAMTRPSGRWAGSKKPPLTTKEAPVSRSTRSRSSSSRGRRRGSGHRRRARGR
jgi:ankyrin repeat protein